jgi:putative aminopeptidase FrvX
MMLADDFISMLREMTALPAISGSEDAMSRHMAAHLQSWADEVTIDLLGNVTARIGTGQPPRIAVLAHMDTVGFQVKSVGADGVVRVVSVGGVNLKALPGTAVRVGNLPGMFGVRSQHLAQPNDAVVRNIEDLYIDIGDVRQVEITTPIIFAPQFHPLGDSLYCGPYMDNRAGCAVLLQLAKRMTRVPEGTIYLIGTVQEETTCAGALRALQAITPDAAIFVDGTLAYDTPDTRGRGIATLGGGPVLTSFLYTSGLNGWHAHPKLRAYLLRVAYECDLPVQQDTIHGLMSDARVATWLGVPSAIVGLPMRNKHAPLETIHLDDALHGIELLLAVLQRPLPDLSRG